MEEKGADKNMHPKMEGREKKLKVETASWQQQQQQQHLLIQAGAHLQPGDPVGK